MTRYAVDETRGELVATWDTGYGAVAVTVASVLGGGGEGAEQEGTGGVDGECAPREHRVLPGLYGPVDQEA
jgi:hypothetical protein